jgi:hypothetical protein
MNWFKWSAIGKTSNSKWLNGGCHCHILIDLHLKKQFNPKNWIFHWKNGFKFCAILKTNVFKFKNKGRNSKSPEWFTSIKAMRTNKFNFFDNQNYFELYATYKTIFPSEWTVQGKACFLMTHVLQDKNIQGTKKLVYGEWIQVAHNRQTLQFKTRHSRRNYDDF